EVLRLVDRIDHALHLVLDVGDDLPDSSQAATQAGRLQVDEVEGVPEVCELSDEIDLRDLAVREAAERDLDAIRLRPDAEALLRLLARRDVGGAHPGHRAREPAL